MDHRWRSRSRAQFGVVVDHLDAPIAIGRSRNVSVDGSFMEAEPTGLDDGKAVELGFTLHVRGRSRRHRVKGMFVHRTVHGVSVLLTRRTYVGSLAA